MAQPTKQPKTMSSRLLTMKFMQRAAASPSPSPSTPPEPASKRQRLSNGSYNSTPASTPRSDAQAVEAALAAKEQKRVDALEREAADRGETKWYLSFRELQKSVMESPLRIVSAGYSSLDSTKEAVSEDDDVVRPSITGRRSFGKFNRKVERQQNPDLSSSDSDSDESDSAEDDDDDDDSDDPTGAKAMIAQTRKEAGDKARAERKAKKKADKAEAQRLAEERRTKKVKLNKLTTISGNTGSQTPNTKDITCHECGRKGHVQRNCPQRDQRRSRRQ